MRPAQLTVPDPEPARKVPGYRMPIDRDSLLTWHFVADQMSQASHYWLTTTFGDGRPHAVPVWGLWHDDHLLFEGSIQTAWAQNLLRDPRMVVHPPDAERVVTIEGVASIIDDADLSTEEWQALDTRFQTKYDVDKGSPYWWVEPTKVLAWNGGGLDTTTRWIFPPSDTSTVAS